MNLLFLAETAGAQTKRRFTQRMESPGSKTFIGSGKLMEITDYIKTNGIDIAIFRWWIKRDTNSKYRKKLSCRILDRNNLILDIFAKRARTAQARAQVELAQYQYLLPRLTRMWTHLEKQHGGIGMRGPGESENRNRPSCHSWQTFQVESKIAWIRKTKYHTTETTQWTGSCRTGQVYQCRKIHTDEYLSKSEVFAENKLFATLDTTVRKIVYDNILFSCLTPSDSYAKLPHDLIESFKSTLDEEEKPTFSFMWWIFHILNLKIRLM